MYIGFGNIDWGQTVLILRQEDQALSVQINSDPFDHPTIEPRGKKRRGVYETLILRHPLKPCMASPVFYGPKMSSKAPSRSMWVLVLRRWQCGSGLRLPELEPPRKKALSQGYSASRKPIGESTFPTG